MVPRGYCGPWWMRARRSATQPWFGQTPSTTHVAPASAYSSASTPGARKATTSQEAGRDTAVR